MVSYCSEACQRLDWKAHKIMCDLIMTNSDFSRKVKNRLSRWLQAPLRKSLLGMYLPRTVPAHLKNTAAVIVLHLKDDIITIESVGQIDYPELSPEMQSEIKVRKSKNELIVFYTTHFFCVHI